MRNLNLIAIGSLIVISSFVSAAYAEVKYTDQLKLHQIGQQVSAKNIEQDITKFE
ncbi:hypothetical protein [Thalassotalea sp. ND16A]|uniref:hypothetical protein n=1 Tax=Thalassotalea sp. ND16A TaxID=1535422 RepID=UPI00051D3CC7|nr:hypothetical protein [Thalassotalea sp. ND16A]KGJ93362.1 hypothetical protein ND16A_1520 [Thalassotalea sp. ND16A]